MYQDFNNGILDRDIKYKTYNIYRVNYYEYLLNVFDSKIKMYLNYKKIKRIIKKSVYFFDNYYVFHINISKK